MKRKHSMTAITLASLMLAANMTPVSAYNGWTAENGNWYYNQEDGTKTVGWFKEGDCWYFFNEDGSMKTGWVASHEHWYYLGGSGVMQKDYKVEENGVSYYVKSNGVMAKEYVKDGIEYDADGKGRPVSEGNSVVVNSVEDLEGISVVEGNLYVTEAVAEELKLSGIEVKGSLVIQSAEHAVLLDDCKVNKVSVQGRESTVTLSGNTEVDQIVLERGAELTADKSYKGNVERIEIQSSVTEAASVGVEADALSVRTYKNVTLDAPVKSVEVHMNTTLTVNADVEEIIVNKNAGGTVVEVGKDSTVQTIVADAKTEIDGEGTVNKVEANVDGVTAGEDTVIKEVEAGKGVSDVPEVNKPNTGGAGGGGGSSSGGGTVKPETKKYTVTFISDGKTHDTQKVEENKKASVPSQPSKDGYKFIGWYVGNNRYDFDTPVTADITLTAKWEEITEQPDETKKEVKSITELLAALNDEKIKTVIIPSETKIDLTEAAELNKEMIVEGTLNGFENLTIKHIDQKDPVEDNKIILNNGGSVRGNNGLAIHNVSNEDKSVWIYMIEENKLAVTSNDATMEIQDSTHQIELINLGISGTASDSSFTYNNDILVGTDGILVYKSKGEIQITFDDANEMSIGLSGNFDYQKNQIVGTVYDLNRGETQNTLTFTTSVTNSNRKLGVYEADGTAIIETIQAGSVFKYGNYVEGQGGKWLLVTDTPEPEEGTASTFEELKDLLKTQDTVTISDNADIIINEEFNVGEEKTIVVPESAALSVDEENGGSIIFQDNAVIWLKGTLNLESKSSLQMAEDAINKSGHILLDETATVKIGSKTFIGENAQLTLHEGQLMIAFNGSGDLMLYAINEATVTVNTEEVNSLDMLLLMQENTTVTVKDLNALKTDEGYITACPGAEIYLGDQLIVGDSEDNPMIVFDGSPTSQNEEWIISLKKQVQNGDYGEYAILIAGRAVVNSFDFEGAIIGAGNGADTYLTFAFDFENIEQRPFYNSEGNAKVESINNGDRFKYDNNTKKWCLVDKTL